MSTELNSSTKVEVSTSDGNIANAVLGVVLSSDLDKVCEISDITTKGFYVYNKDKQNSAKQGKQWGKHFLHFDAFIHICMHPKNAKIPINRAFQRKAK